MGFIMTNRKWSDTDYVIVNNYIIKINDVCVLGIEKDLQSFELITFKYNGKKYRSKVYHNK